MTVHVVVGDDPILRAQTLDELLTVLAGDEDRSLLVEEHRVPGRRGATSAAGEAGPADGTAVGAADDDAGDAEAGEPDAAAVVAAIVNAALSPPFVTARRIVVVRDVANLRAGDVPPLLACLAELLDTTELVFVVDGGKVPPGLTKAWKAANAQEHGERRVAAKDVLAAVVGEAGLALEPGAAETLIAHVGEEGGRIPGIVEVLLGVYGPGATLGLDDVAPYLGEVGGVPGYELTNAIEEGDVPGALAVLHRLLRASGPRQPQPMHPLQVMALLHNRLRRLARLDADDVRSVADAHAAWGGKGSTFPAKKGLAYVRRVGSDGLREAYAALGAADLDLKGARAVPEEVVMEVLVARLAALSARAGASGRRRPARR